MLENEFLIRMSVFLGLFAVLAVVERLMPRRARRPEHVARWLTNWGLSLLNTAALRLVAIVIPLLAIGAAIDALFCSLILLFGVSMSLPIKCRFCGGCTKSITPIPRWMSQRPFASIPLKLRSLCCSRSG
jgi:hypothetical protein